MPWFAVALPYVVAGVAAYGAIRQGEAAKAASDFNQTVDQQNAAIARSEATFNAAQQDRENYLRQGTMRAAYGAAGVTEAGSVLDVIGDAAAQGKLATQRIKYTGELKARGYNNMAYLEEQKGSTAQTAGYMNAAADIMGGASHYYNKGTPDTSQSAYNSDFTLKRSR